MSLHHQDGANRIARPGRVACTRAARPRGFTMVELLLAMAICTVLTAIAVPAYRATVKSMHTKQAVKELTEIAAQIERYRTVNAFQLPASLSDLTDVPSGDPWGNPYRYLRFAGSSPGHIRKDHNLHPINSEFDLYSMGPDGASVSPLTARASRDDILWARDGGFVGVASDF